MVRHDMPTGVAAAALSCDYKARGDCYPFARPACYPPAARLLWVWLCSVRARAARVEVRDTRACVSLLLGTVGAEADCLDCLIAAGALEWWWPPAAVDGG